MAKNNKPKSNNKQGGPIINYLNKARSALVSVWQKNIFNKLWIVYF